MAHPNSDTLVSMNEELREPRYVYDVDDHYKTKHYKSKLSREWKAEIMRVIDASNFIDCNLVEGQHNQFSILANGPEGAASWGLKIFHAFVGRVLSPGLFEVKITGPH